jgi:hypothetical protein
VHLSQLLVRAAMDDRLEAVRLLLTATRWVSSASFGVAQSALTKFCVRRSLIGSLVVPSNATVSLFRPKYARRITKFLGGAKVDTIAVDEVPAKCV